MADYMQTDKVNSSLEKRNLQLILKYAYMLDVLIYHNVHLTYFDYTLPILQNFEKTICVKKFDWTSFKFSALKV